MKLIQFKFKDMGIMSEKGYMMEKNKIETDKHNIDIVIVSLIAIIFSMYIHMNMLVLLSSIVKSTGQGVKDIFIKFFQLIISFRLTEGEIWC